MKIDLKEKSLSLKEALNQAKEGDILYLEDKVYKEKIIIDKPNLTLLGQPNTKITYGASHGTILPAELGGDGKKTFGTTGLATCTVKPSASGFKAVSIQFENSFKRNQESGGQAVAFKSECDNITLRNCKFLSHQDTLYIDEGTGNIVQDCYIEGDIDFIFGSADCLFLNCQIHAIQEERQIAYYTAPSTLKRNEQGFEFRGCHFTADQGMELSIGRAWFPGGAKEPLYPRLKLVNCTLLEKTSLGLKRMHRENPTNYVFTIEDCRLEQEEYDEEEAKG